MSGREREVLVAELGAAGDGVARAEEGRIFVPLALPGERWRVRLERRLREGWAASALACLEPGPRAEPCCPHFGRCGGCRLQHLPDSLYRSQRRDRIVAALAHRGLPGESVEEVRVVPLASRRRLRLALARGPRGLILGFRQRESHRLVSVSVCPVARPELVALLPRLAAGLGGALARPEPGEVSLTVTDSGIDLLLRPHRRLDLDLDRREALVALAESADLARLSWGDRATAEPVVVRRAPLLLFGEIRIDPPPGVFLQATKRAEQAMRAAVSEWAGGASRLVDLFAGIGALTLGRPGKLALFESDPPAVAAIDAARRRLAAGSVTVERRDLFRNPLTAAELDAFDAVVLDPPRAGATAQSGELARSKVPRVIYGSCDPGSFARDARTLQDGGYRLEKLLPIDQFLW